jgi:hypothetical protein
MEEPQPLPQDSVKETLDQRGKRYGSFEKQAELSQALSQTMIRHYFNNHQQPTTPLPPFIVEAINNICHKLARIANGDPLYVDSWRDIAGYSSLVAEILKTTEGATDAKVTNTKFTDGKWTDTT